MIDRITLNLLRTGLLLSAVAAILYLVRMIVAAVLPIEWHWGGAVASLLAPPAFAAALYLSADHLVPAKVRA